MAEFYGAMTLPIAEPGPDDSVSDPLIDYTLSYFKAFINAYGATAWQAVMPNALPVTTVKPNDPEELDFNERDLPCLYMWRTGADNGKPERLAEDIWIMRDQLHVFWVFPPARQAIRALRGQFVAGMAKMLHVAIELGRDPSWVVPGDPDSSSATLGSVFPRFAKFDEMSLGKWTSKMMTIPIANGQPRNYPAFYTTIDVVEPFERSLERYDLIGGLDLKLYEPTNTLLVDEYDSTL